MAHLVLVPGLWLDGSSWDGVTPALERAGHRCVSLTLPGMAARDADRSGIGLRDHVAAVVAAVDHCDPDDQVVLVSHSAGGAPAHAAVDARPERIQRAVHVAAFPLPDGLAAAPDLPAVGADVPLPDWSDFDDAELVGLDADLRAAFRARALPSPVGACRDRQRLVDERRYDVPVTAVSTEYSSAQLREWIGEGEPAVQEFARIRDVDYVDLPTGHWPQFTRPDDLAGVILAAVESPPATS